MKKRITLTAGMLAMLAGTAIADVRSYDGSNNNLFNPTWGQSGTVVIRGLSGAHYADGLSAMVSRANPRAVSNAVSVQTPAGLGNARNLSAMAWQWGQFIDHDFALIDENPGDTIMMPMPAGDPFFDPGNTGTAVMPFSRSVCVDGVSTPRQQVSSITHWLDGSNVYGSDSARAGALRSFSGGKLNTSAGDMLPYNTGGLPNAMGTSASFFVAGDVRSNEQTGLTAMHTIFVREHNRLADQIASANPSWSDEDIYQHARKLVGAEIQAVTYNEWLPAMMGGTAPGAYTGYNASVDGRMSTAFSTAAFRIGHTMLNDQLLRFNEDGSVFAGGHLSLFQSFFTPSTIDTPAELDAVVRGLALQASNEIDTQAIDGVRNLLFGPGMTRDLIALNIERGRDHGLPDYNTLRQDYGLTALVSFSQITSNAALAQALSDVYSGNINDVDPWIALMAEDHLPGSSMGETLTAVFFDQFDRLRAGDRFYFLNDNELSQSEKDWLMGLKLSDIITANSGIESIQANVFFIPAPSGAALLALSGLAASSRRRRA